LRERERGEGEREGERERERERKKDLPLHKYIKLIKLRLLGKQRCKFR
jgi:hypothetical protein